MPNTQAVGVAFSDPELSGASITNSTFTSSATTGAVIANATAGLYFLTTAITAGTTTTTAPAGSIATTTNGTGAGKFFVSVAGKWEFPVLT